MNHLIEKLLLAGLLFTSPSAFACEIPEPEPEPICETVTASVEQEHVPFIYAAVEQELSSKLTVRGQVIVPFGMQFVNANNNRVQADDIGVIPGVAVTMKVAKSVSAVVAADAYVGEHKTRGDYSAGISVEAVKDIALNVSRHFGDLGHGTTVGVKMAF